MKCWSICLLINLFVCHLANGQTIASTASLRKPAKVINAGSQLPTHFSGFADTTTAARLYNTPFTFKASNYYTSTLGFFCKKELQVEKALKFPLKFRLGNGLSEQTFIR